MSSASRAATDLATRIAGRCDELARISSMPDGIRRVYLSSEHARANDLAARWMTDAGLRVRQDAAGNLRGRTAGDDTRPVLLLGSHLDTVVDAGRYDGIVGVLMGIAIVEMLGDRVHDLPVTIEVIAFSDEEGTRFGKALMGSSAVAGVWDDAWWELVDEDGVTLRDAFTAFGLDPARVHEAAVDPATLVGYLEAHIEQGPYLERADQALGVVTSIAAARRFTVDVVGEARHAGGTPYEMRHDALLGAAEAALAVERICIAERHVGTVGTMHVEPGAVNVVPGHARFSVDLRGEFDDGRDRVWDEITSAFDAIAGRRGLRVSVSEVHRAPAVFCAPRLTDAVRSGIATTGEGQPMELFSRAGHDAMSLGLVTDVAMLFLRNPGGISHHPDEFVSTDDVALGLDALLAAVLDVAAGQGAST
ncbi:allantoate amidohydrolase [Curtobacterium sp. 22159]|uniref:allantoate amidohydrolase n=1 Tax=Curtobacterium sp. 22159 TaxID=3453882 RepID=UPI003F83A83E